VDKLARELIRIVKLPDVKERLNSQGLDAVGTTPDEVSALITKETAMYAKLIKDIGYKPQ
jgi:tripartite-type tricarboxylate transporter receptor subunit TctC